MAVKMIIATGKDFSIGKDNKLLWHIPEDMKHFKKQTKDSVVVMGNNTFKSLGMKNGLSQRNNVVLTSSASQNRISLTIPVSFVNDIDWFKDNALKYFESCHVDVWIIGGAKIYEQMKDVVDEVHWTIVNRDYSDADTHFDMSFVEDTDNFELLSESVLCDEAMLRVYKRF